MEVVERPQSTSRRTCSSWSPSGRPTPAAAAHRLASRQLLQSRAHLVVAERSRAGVLGTGRRCGRRVDGPSGPRRPGGPGAGARRPPPRGDVKMKLSARPPRRPVELGQRLEDGEEDFAGRSSGSREPLARGSRRRPGRSATRACSHAVWRRPWSSRSMRRGEVVALHGSTVGTPKPASGSPAIRHLSRSVPAAGPFDGSGPDWPPPVGGARRAACSGSTARVEPGPGDSVRAPAIAY